MIVIQRIYDLQFESFDLISLFGKPHIMRSVCSFIYWCILVSYNAYNHILSTEFCNFSDSPDPQKIFSAIINAIFFLESNGQIKKYFSDLMISTFSKISRDLCILKGKLNTWFMFTAVIVLAYMMASDLVFCAQILWISKAAR